jgi:hypothetical protein
MVAASYQKGGATAEQRRQQVDQGFNEYQRYLAWMPDAGKAKTKDVYSLLGLSEFILSDRKFWGTKQDLCQASAERALTLANELHAPDLVARARADLGTHALNLATKASNVDLAALRKSADHFKAAVDADDNLATAPLSALERQSLRYLLAPAWRYALANVYGRLASDSHTSAADRQTLRKDALKVLDNAKDLNEDWKKLYKESRKTLQEIR